MPKMIPCDDNRITLTNVTDLLKEYFCRQPLDRIMNQNYKENTHFTVRPGRKEWGFDKRSILYLEPFLKWQEVRT